MMKIKESVLTLILSILFVKESNFAFTMVKTSTSIEPPFFEMALSLYQRLYVLAISSKRYRASSGVFDMIVSSTTALMFTFTNGLTPL